MTQIKEIFSRDISRRIEEVIKVDQTDEKILREEIDEYIVTDSINENLIDILDIYNQTPNNPREGIAIWVSGFFGSGKSSFAKYLGLALENRSVDGESIAKLLGQRSGDNKTKVLLRSISENIPTHAVIFDVSTDRGIRSGNMTLTEIMYRLFLKSLGYPEDLDLAELEIALESEGQLDQFSEKFKQCFSGKTWDEAKRLTVLAMQQASRVMHEMDSDTYPSADSWRQSARNRADITPSLLASRIINLTDRRKPGHAVVFVIDEVGQFVARDVQKMLDLQGIVQRLGVEGQGRIWIVVTSQEKLNELVGGLDSRQVELARLTDRFPQELQVHLEPADISKVTSERVLEKNTEGETLLRKMFEKHRGRLTSHTNISADIRLPELNPDNFVSLYPMLPYQVDLIINIVSGLRTQGGAITHVGGANRTIIKLAQQLLIHEQVGLGEKELGQLATLDQIYDLVCGNINSELRGKIDEIDKQTDHRLAQPVAKAICLLQFVKSIHRTPENIAACLHAAVDADSRLSEIREALTELETRHLVRLGEDGYRIPSPVEDDWEKQRNNVSPTPGDRNRILHKTIVAFWKPAPSFNLHNVKAFKAGLLIDERQCQTGDINFHVALDTIGPEYEERTSELRQRSQSENQAVFWSVGLDESIEHQVVEVFRSEDVLTRRERSARGDEAALVGEEKRRRGRHESELKRLLKQAMISGSVFFGGNDRSPGADTTEPKSAAENVLSHCLPEVFHRFEEAAAHVRAADLDQLMQVDRLDGLPSVFVDLSLLEGTGTTTQFKTETGPLHELYQYIDHHASYGASVTGQSLDKHFGAAPYGWEFDVIRLFVVSLLRAQKIEATAGGKIIDDARSVEAKTLLIKNRDFRNATIRPRTTEIEFKDLVQASACFGKVFGNELPELSEKAAADQIRSACEKHEESMRQQVSRLTQLGLPGTSLLDGAINDITGFRNQRSAAIIKSFIGGFQRIKDANKRAHQLEGELTTIGVEQIERAQSTLLKQWPEISNDPNIDDALEQTASALQDRLASETFFENLPQIDQATQKIVETYDSIHSKAIAKRVEAYQKALDLLNTTPGWSDLDEDQKQAVLGDLGVLAEQDAAGDTKISMLREQTNACDGRLTRAQQRLAELIDGNRVETVKASIYFSGGIENVEQLDAAVSGLRQRCLELIAAGKKVLIQ